MLQLILPSSVHKFCQFSLTFKQFFIGVGFLCLANPASTQAASWLGSGRTTPIEVGAVHSQMDGKKIGGTGYTVIILERCDIIGIIMNQIVLAAVGYVYNWYYTPTSLPWLDVIRFISTEGFFPQALVVL